MAAPIQFVAGAGLKAAIVVFTIISLVLLDPSYVTAYISVNYEIILIYIVSENYSLKHGFHCRYAH